MPSDETKSTKNTNNETKPSATGDNKPKPLSGSTISVVIQETSDGQARAVREGRGFSNSGGASFALENAVNDPRILDEQAQNIALSALFDQMTLDSEAEQAAKEQEKAAAIAAGETAPEEHEDDEQKIICSGCYQVKDMEENHVIPTWNETLENFVTSFRCNGCWRPSLDDTRRRIEQTNNPILVKMLVDFFGRHRIVQDELDAATTTPERKKIALKLITDIWMGRLVIPLGETIALTRDKMEEMRRVWNSANGEIGDPLGELLEESAREEAILAKLDAQPPPAKKQDPAAAPPRKPNNQTILQNISSANKKKPGGWFNA